MDKTAFPSGGAPPPAKTSNLAIASLILGILSVLSCCCFLNIPAIILGLVSLGSIRESGFTLKGRPLALAGIITASISLLVGIILVYYIFVAPGGLMFGDQIPSKYVTYMTAEGFLQKDEKLQGFYDLGMPWTHEAIFMTDRKIGNYDEKDLNAIQFDEIQDIHYEEGSIINGDKVTVSDEKGNIVTLMLPGMGEGRQFYERANKEWIKHGGGSKGSGTPGENEAENNPDTATDREEK